MSPLPRPALFLLALLLLAGCANSSTPSGSGRDRDGATGEDAGSGAGMDAGGGGTDGGGGGTDGGGGTTDGGPVESCVPGTEDFCTSACGTRGTRLCSSAGTWGSCTPPPEDCNGMDDDCDGTPDEGLGTRPCSSECGGGSEACVDGAWSGCTAVDPGDEICDDNDNDCDSMIDEGLTRGCSTACGSGTETCNRGSWIGCTAPAPATEVCNGTDDDCDGSADESLSRACSTACGSGTETCSSGSWTGCTAPTPSTEACSGSDDDCDGTVDEGFRATTRMTDYPALASEHASCNGTTERMGPACNAAIHRYCADFACTQSGFGPVENSGTIAYVTCVKANVRSTTFTTLSGHHAPCNGSTERLGPNCNAAVHRYCRSTGALSGFGPVENSGDNASVSCIPSGNGEVRTTSYTALSGEHAPCDGSTERWGPNCNAAIHRWCRAQGFESGFGPVENTGDTAVVTCVSP